jgi:hypothetical protein
MSAQKLRHPREGRGEPGERHRDGAAFAVATQGANYSQQVATLVTRQALDAERSVAAYVCGFRLRSSAARAGDTVSGRDLPETVSDAHVDDLPL